MERNLSISSFKKLPKGFLLAFLFIFVFELINISLDNYLYKPYRSILTGLRFKIKNEIARTKENNFDILILGDSHSLTGIVPRIIEKETGLSCFNFSFSSNQKLVGYYFIFKNYLKSHHQKPKYVIIGFIPFTTYPVTKSVYSKNAVDSLVDLNNGNVMTFIEEFGVAQGIKFLLPSLKHQGRFRDFINDPFSFDIPSKTQINNAISQVYKDKGYYPHPRERETPGGERFKNEYELLFKDYDLNNFVVSAFSYKYLKSILDLAKENKITPVYYVPALPQYAYDKLKESGYMKQHNDFINSLKKDYPDLVALTVDGILNEDDMFKDLYHLTQKGASVLSSFLSEKINGINMVAHPNLSSIELLTDYRE